MHRYFKTTKCCDLGCDVERPPLKNFKDLNETLELKYFFWLHLQTQIFIFISCMNEGSEMTKMLAHVNRMKKNPQTRAGIFWVFTDFHEVIRLWKQRTPLHRNSINDTTTLKSSINYMNQGLCRVLKQRFQSLESFSKIWIGLFQ